MCRVHLTRPHLVRLGGPHFLGDLSLLRKADFSHLSVCRAWEQCLYPKCSWAPRGEERESGSDIQQAWDPWPSTAKDCHCLPLLGLLGQDAALRRVMEASRGQRSQLVPIWVLTVFRVFVSHATSPAVDLGGRCALGGGMAFSDGASGCAGTADSFRLRSHWQA